MAMKRGRSIPPAGLPVLSGVRLREIMFGPSPGPAYSGLFGSLTFPGPTGPKFWSPLRWVAGLNFACVANGMGNGLGAGSQYGLFVGKYSFAGSAPWQPFQSPAH